MSLIVRPMLRLLGRRLRRMSLAEKQEMLAAWIPRVLADLSLQDRLALMQKMLPHMIGDIGPEDVGTLMDTMMPMMMSVLTGRDPDAEQTLGAIGSQRPPSP